MSAILVIGLTPCFAFADVASSASEVTATIASAVAAAADVDSSHGTVSGQVTGLDQADISSATVILYNDANSFAAKPSSDASFAFADIEPGTFYLKIEVDGYSVPYPSTTVVSAGQITTTKLEVTKAENSSYFYNWKADESYFGYEETAQVVEQPEFTFVDKNIYVSNSGASVELASDYKVYLVDDEVAWTSDYASRVLDLFGDLGLETWECTPSKWVITNDHINNDVELTYSEEEGNTVRISIDAFQNAVPKLAQLDGLYGSYYSNKLFDVIVRYATKNGTDTDAADNILQRNFGCSVKVPDYEALTARTTGETAAAFEMFKPEELISIICMFQEMPEGFHKISGLKYLVRRIDGSVNPLFPQAAAVSWVNNDPGYIEFIDGAFLGDVVNDTFRLILHEKTHFLWHDLFSDSTKQQWEQIGGWHEDSTTESGWSTDKMTEFVTAYSHDINPDEDMAESVAYYILDPAKLQANAPEKYEFIKNCIMHGETYKTQIREDLTFEVYNLYPDYAYPGRIVGLSIDVQGEPEEDKTITFTVDLDTHGDASFGASNGQMRIQSAECDQFYDLWLQSTNDDGSQLQGSITVSKYSAADYWKCVSFFVNDEAGNTRYLNDNNFGWKLYLDNPLEDLEAPKYVDDSITVTQQKETLENGHTITHVVINFYATDNTELSSCYCEIANNTHDTYRLDKWGTVDAETGLCTVQYDFSEYYPDGEYSINHLSVHDKAGNASLDNFYSDGSGSKSYTTFQFESENSDLVGPELDVNNISITATPTNPDNPNGETIVKLGFWIRDNISGFDYGSYDLLDPQGNVHMNYFYSDNYYQPYFDGDATAWKYYESTMVLPVGSAPGIWGLQSMKLNDKAANFSNYNFEEIVHFTPATEEQLASWGIRCDTDTLTVGESCKLSVEGNSDNLPVVWECTNGTGKAIVDSSGELTALSEGKVTVIAYAKENMSVYGTLDVEIQSVSSDADISSGKLEVSGSAVYMGRAVEPSVAVTVGGKTLAAGTDYAVSYSGNEGFGTGRATVTGRGNYSGTLTADFAIASDVVNVFSDASHEDWYVESGALDYAYAHGLISGYSGTDLVGAYDPIKRQDVAVILWRMAGEPEVASGDGFEDVDYGDYYGPAVRWARATGVINGYQDADGAYRTFGPSDLVTREQLAAMIANYAEKVGGMTVSSNCAKLDALPDAGSVSDWARTSVGWCMDNDIMNGVNVEGTAYAQPSGNAWRASMASMAAVLHRDVLKLG